MSNQIGSSVKRQSYIIPSVTEYEETKNTNKESRVEILMSEGFNELNQSVEPYSRYITYDGLV